MRARARARACLRSFVCVRACAYACANASVCACVCVSLCVSVLAHAWVIKSNSARPVKSLRTHIDCLTESFASSVFQLQRAPTQESSTRRQNRATVHRDGPVSTVLVNIFLLINNIVSLMFILCP